MQIIQWTEVTDMTDDNIAEPAAIDVPISYINTWIIKIVSSQRPGFTALT
jgi:hypothetical protein